jgi:hypothetical protein
LSVVHRSQGEPLVPCQLRWMAHEDDRGRGARWRGIVGFGWAPEWSAWAFSGTSSPAPVRE